MSTTQRTCGDATVATISERIRALLSLDDMGEGPVGVCGKHPRGIHLSEFERDLMEWGLVYGMAFAMARSEDPWETIESVAARAFMPALAAYTDWSGDMAKPDRNELVSAVISAYGRQPSGRQEMSEELEDALVRLYNGSGS